MAGVAAEAQWKDKYRDLVRDYETKEREWSALEHALRAAAGKLAFAAMGQNAALDKAVESVLSALRTGPSATNLDATMSGLVRALQLPKTEEAPPAPKPSASTKPAAATNSAPERAAPAPPENSPATPAVDVELL